MKPNEHDTLLKCKACGRGFSTAEGLLEHAAAKHGSRRAAYGQSHLKRNGLILLAVLVVVLVGYNVVNSISSSQNVAVGTGSQPNGASVGLATGDAAPDFQISMIDGSNAQLSSYRGGTVLLWFVATWCSSCTQGAQLLASQYYPQLHSKGVTILTVELYNDLGQPGPSISQFASEFAGGTNPPGWLFGTTGQAATYKYDPNAYLDVWYLLNKQGVIIDRGTGLPNGLPTILSEV